VANLPDLAAVIACPGAGLSTAAVYGRCIPDAARRGDARRLADALATGGLPAGLPFMTNALEPPARSLSPEIDRVLRDLERAGGFAPRLTGSGSACFALARTIAEATAVAARLTARRQAGDAACAAIFVVRLAAPA
jgi:4-diphosphocytidyl-2-C-methyl-D-erythritol kinase